MQAVGIAFATPAPQVAFGETVTAPPVHFALGAPHPQSVQVRVSEMPVSKEAFTT
jgi:hypothetical protein